MRTNLWLPAWALLAAGCGNRPPFADVFFTNGAVLTMGQCQPDRPGRLYGKVVEFAELTEKETVLDLYSGTGTIPIFLANSASRVVGLEIAESAVSDARRNCQANGIENCEFILGEIRDNLTLLSIRPEVMVIDPPRAGMHQDVLARVLEIGAERIVYVSCNPATLARDLGRMKERYHILEIQPVDMFPPTPITLNRWQNWKGKTCDPRQPTRQKK